MARVDPEQLEREAEDLMRQAGLIPDPDKQPDTPEKPDEPPAPQADTGEPQLPVTEDEPDRGDQENEGSDDGQTVPMERYKNAQAAMTRATQEAAQLRTQVADLNQRLATLEASGGSAKPTPASADEAEAAIQKALDEYPEIVGPLLTRLRSVEATVQSDREAVAERQRQDQLDAHMSAIRGKHSDLDQIVDDPEFHGWVHRQTPAWQQIAAGGTAEEVIELLDRYKAAAGITTEQTPQRETALDRARKVAEPTLPKGRKPDPNANKRQWTRAEIARMPLEEYERNREEIDRAYLEGRVR
jgi:hypothetical protein